MKVTYEGLPLIKSVSPRPRHDEAVVKAIYAKLVEERGTVTAADVKAEYEKEGVTISLETVRKKIGKTGKGSQPYTQEEVTLIAQLASEGRSAPEIAEAIKEKSRTNPAEYHARTATSIRYKVGDIRRRQESIELEEVVLDEDKTR